jgi:hypothetical protein
MNKIFLLLAIPLSVTSHDFFKEVCKPKIDAVVSQETQREITAYATKAPSCLSAVMLGTSAFNVLGSMRQSYLKAISGLPIASALFLGGVKEVQKVQNFNIKTDINPYVNGISAFTCTATLSHLAYKNLRNKPGMLSKVASAAYAFTAYQQLNETYRNYKKSNH